MKPFKHPLRPEDVGALIDLTIADNPDTQSMAQLQLRGIAALYNILCDRPYAYLADEVGMGKTYQALGLAAVLWNEKPTARILFLSPRQNLQEKWVADYRRFFASNYRRAQGLGDDRGTCVVLGEPIHQPVRYDNLRSWTPTIGLAERIAVFIRHTSFMRPITDTRHEDDDMGALWSRAQKRMHNWGLFHARRPRRLQPDNASERLNIAFGRALNQQLKEEGAGKPYFDLVIVDEAQCLRNPGNQTNRVLHAALQGQVRRWLFMSATPVHGGPRDLPTILNHYPGQGEVLDPELTHDLPALQAAIQPFLVRRQREYRTRGGGFVGKRTYRRHEPDDWSITDREMSPLATLATGLMQKALVNVLEGQNNKYRIGFLSSFESLQASIRSSHPRSEEEDPDNPTDWRHDPAERPSEREAPDTEVVSRLATDFEARFDRPLPHPKVDALVKRIAPLAFGTDKEPGGQKFLVFTRRISTVEVLRRLLDLEYHQAIEARIRRCWGVTLDWSGPTSEQETPLQEPDADPEAFDQEAGPSPLRAAMARKGWLNRYRQTFRTSGRNALFFEDGWLSRLCSAGGVSEKVAAQRMPNQLWAESYTHASRSSGASRQHYRAHRLRYLAVHAVRRCPEIFGLDTNTATPWREAYEAALCEHLGQVAEASSPHRSPELFSTPTLWTQWDQAFPKGPMALPAAQPVQQSGNVLTEQLHRRQVVRTLLSQSFRLTDTLLDLFYANQEAKQQPEFGARFLRWLSSDDPGARQLRTDCERWIAHHRLIVDSSLDGAGQGLADLARRETWPQLHNPSAVLGVTGGSGGHRVATRQFRTPSLPRVIVCTDTLKEGVDLHLFCDRVVHYGVAWTSGDLEQRVGRVDRFFSQIERRLQVEGPPPEVQLEVGYPHVAASLERDQVVRVIERQRAAEELMDSPLAGASRDERALVIGAHAPRGAATTVGPYSEHPMPVVGRRIVQISTDDARAQHDHYARWYHTLHIALGERGKQVSPSSPRPERVATVSCRAQSHDLRWSHDPGLGRYILTASQPRKQIESEFSGGHRVQIRGKTRHTEGFVQLLVPTPAEGIDQAAITRLINALDGEGPDRAEAAHTRWHSALKKIATSGVDWQKPHKAQLTVARGDRGHTVSLYAYEHGVRILGTVAQIEDLAHDPNRWRGAPDDERVKLWALQATNELGLGYLDVHPRDGLVFGVHVIHGQLSKKARQRLVQEVAWRADAWEARLTGEDVW